MKSPTFTRTIAALCALAAVAWAGQGYAAEPGDGDPHEPAATGGSPNGALPPPGVYFINNFNMVNGSLTNGNGDVNTPASGHTTVNVNAFVEIPVLLYSSPIHILGAQYGALMIAPLVNAAVTTNGVTHDKSGINNTTINPAILSWQLPAGFFVSVSLPIGLKDGDTEGNAGAGTIAVSHIAANYWTIGPSASVAWFNGHGTEVALNGELDFTTADNNALAIAPGLPKVKYQQGDFLTLDYGVTQVLPGAYRKWSLGIVGSFVTQLTDDTITNFPGVANGGSVPANFLNGANSAGNRVTIFAIGPSVAYNFGPLSMQIFYTRDVLAKNTVQNNTLWWVTAIPF